MTHNVGDTVYIDFSKYGTVRVLSGKVVKVTPSGQISVEIGKDRVERFNNRGNMIGAGGNYDIPHLISRDQYERYSERAELQNKERVAGHCIGEVAKIRPVAANRAELLKMLRQAIAAVEALPEA